MGDQLELLPQPNDGRELFITDPSQGAGFVTFTNGNEVVQFDDIETVDMGGSSNATYPGPGDGESLDDFFASFDQDDLSEIA